MTRKLTSLLVCGILVLSVGCAAHQNKYLITLPPMQPQFKTVEMRVEARG